ncbi:hypothetical protein I5729_05285 [Acinetobacter bereziniae]|uniref:helix-turn-helix domain-containing protein n=1 Tax=Acinetobacter bereziniae TaxID=106648 RepID=UPI0019002863|nr:hypothetical protein [Acinetobacter bereziniae]MBJ9948523.1 hypothetical protein [Acinetobacter bereziniae]
MNDFDESNSTELNLVDVKKIRNKTRMSQKEFCLTFGLNLNTLRHWERGNRVPHGSALTLLNMINNSPKEVYSILGHQKEYELNTQHNKDILKKIILSEKYSTFKELQQLDSEDFISVVFSLIEANGFPYKQIDKENGSLIFLAGHDAENLKPILKFNNLQEEGQGDLKSVIEKSYLVIFAIENQLNDLIYLPPEMRKEEISRVLKNLGVDESFYTNILKNW